MKKAKRIAGIMLALLMVLAMAIPAFAAPGDPADPTTPPADPALADMEGELTGGKITISNAVTGQTYNLYQILYLESYKVSEPSSSTQNNGTDRYGNYAYKPTTSWAEWLKDTPPKDGSWNDPKDFIAVDSTSNYATWKPTDTQSLVVARFAKLALAYAKENPSVIKPVKTHTVSETETHFSFDGLQLGYYLIDSTVGTLCELYTTNSDIIIDDKNTPPTVVKKVKENGETYPTNDASIGDKVEFTSNIVARKGGENYVFHDKMPNSIKFEDVTSITTKISSTPAEELRKYVDDSSLWDYKVVLPPPEKPFPCECTFHVEFNQTYLDSLEDNFSNIDIYYYGTLLDTAEIGGNRTLDTDGLRPSSSLDGCDEKNVNTCWLTSGENGTVKSQVSKTYTYTWEFMFHKIAHTNAGANEAPVADASNAISLPGAEFVLRTKNDETTLPLKFRKTSDTENPDAGFIYILDPTGTEEITTGTTGKITLRGLDSNTYFLFETKAPDGYNKLFGPASITITQNGKIMRNSTPVEEGQHVDIRNSSGSLMPSTGGIGTTIFYIVGGVLLVGAGVLLVVRKRMNSAKESR